MSPAQPRQIHFIFQNVYIISVTSRFQEKLVLYWLDQQHVPRTPALHSPDAEPVQGFLSLPLTLLQQSRGLKSNQKRITMQIIQPQKNTVTAVY